MAITPFGKGRDADSEGQTSSSSPAPASKASGGLSAFIDQGSEFEGKLSFRDTVRIDGRFRGEIASENTLIVGESGEIDAEIHSKTVSISGKVNGNVVAASKVVIHKTAQVDGDIEAPALIVEDGAKLNGRITMTSESGKSAKPLKAVSASSGSKTEPGSESSNN